MSPPDAEILAQIQKVQSELYIALPSDIRLEAEDVTPAQIRIRLLRARLELSAEQEQIPLPLVRLLALLFELTGHSEELSGLLDASTNQPQMATHEAVEHGAVPTRETLLASMRNALLKGDVTALRSILEQQRFALIPFPAPVMPSASEVDNDSVPPS